MRISIVTINFNNKTGLEKTIQSVIYQTYPFIEYIIIDGGSTDGSIEVIKENEDKITYWVSEPDRGIYHAMNKGVEKATGDYLMFLNSGDWLLDRNVIETCYQSLIEKPVDVLYGDMLIPNRKQKNQQEKIFHPVYFDLYFMRYKNLNHQATLFHHKIFQEIGGYPKKYALAGDYWLYLNCFIQNFSFKKIDVTLIYYDFTGLSTTNRKQYDNEMHLIWDDIVPKQITNLMDSHEFLIKKNNRVINKYLNRIADFYYKLRG